MKIIASSIALALGIVPAAAHANCTVSQLLELKATMNRAMPMVTVGINGSDQQFLVDSGAFFSTISSAKAAELKLHLEALPPGYVVRGIGGEMHPTVARVETVSLAGVPLKKVPFIVGGGDVGNGAGLLGQNVLGLGDVEYDLAHGGVRLMRPHDCKNVSFAYWAGSKPVSVVTIDPRDANNPHTIGTILVNGVKMRATFDTGAGSTVMSLAAAARIGLKPDSPGVRAAGYDFGIGRHTVAAYVLPIDSIKLGDGEEIRRTHIRATQIDMPNTDILVGADFFLSHRVYVANSLHKLFFTYDGGPIFNVTPSRVIAADGSAAAALTDDVNAEPKDAEGFSRRGAAYMAKRDYPRAIADLDKACDLAPGESRYYLLRAEAHARNRQPLLAMDDLDKTLKLDPGNAEARLARASIRLSRHDRAAAEEDIATVDHDAAPAAGARLTLAGMYNTLEEPAKAIAQYDLWLKYHGDDSRRPIALNGRCWSRALLGVDLSKALADCDAAVKAHSDSASYLDSRGLVRLRLGDNDKAVRDYDAALALQPKMAWPLYGRGLAKQRLGQAAEGQKDIDAATALDATLPARARRLGIVS